MEDSRVVKKILRVVPKKMKQVAVAIEMLMDLNTMSMEELVGRLRVAEKPRDVDEETGGAGRLLLTEEQWEGLLITQTSKWSKIMGSSNSERAKKALDAMKQLGFSKKQTTPVLKNLLKLFNYNWEPIEDECYRALVEAVLDAAAADDCAAIPSHHSAPASASPTRCADDDSEVPLVKRPRIGSSPSGQTPSASTLSGTSAIVNCNKGKSPLLENPQRALVFKHPKPEPQIDGPVANQLITASSGADAGGSVANQVQNHDRSIHALRRCKNAQLLIITTSMRLCKSNWRCYDANLILIPVEVETPDHCYYHLAFFTAKKVEAFEELTWGYGIDFEGLDCPNKAFQGMCGSRYCRDLNNSTAAAVQLDHRYPMAAAAASSVSLSGPRALPTWSSSVSGDSHSAALGAWVARPRSARPPRAPARMGNVNEGKGIFAPLVVVVRNIIGRKRFNQLRGKAIALHSQVITEFCKTIGADAKQRQGLIRLAKKNGEKLGFLA
ncbi:hypothetical protein E2562_035471 [Oryza meyeriana var. granulata]|uniref:WIYLD domain-containing protein n=1 Tax=Oryza meyeriana var. granulata TaxID=110450 RepID=A0A6G1CJK3_9ORYZ|nr:hypothetical protein E2562_035471 [Oryza meyeriana var. granulata]